jgi:hypothetical protein
LRGILFPATIEKGLPEDGKKAFSPAAGYMDKRAVHCSLGSAIASTASFGREASPS